METRQITEVKIYKLILNPMRGNTENGSIVAIAYEKQKLIDWYNSKLAPEVLVEEGSPSFECHGDSHKWHKTFRAGSELEWYNPCYGNFEPNHYGHGISEQWATEEAVQRAGFTFIY